MSSSPFEGEMAQDDVALVAETANEPAYLGEIARKLIEAGLWDTSLTNGVRRVSKAIEALTSDTDEDEYMLERISAGQVEGSVHKVLGGETFGGVSTSKGWRKYKLFYAETEFVRSSIENVIDRRTTFSSKKEKIRRLSQNGLEQAKIVEDILQDLVEKNTRDRGEFQVSAFKSPTPDIYIEDFTALFPIVKDVSKGKVVEITNRWENPVGDEYVSRKFNMAMDMESERGVEVDVLIMAPRFSGEIQERVEEAGEREVVEVGEGVVSVARVPEEGTGIPVVVANDESIMQQLIGSPIVGDDYPVVESKFERYQKDMESVYREYNTIPESEYRVREIEDTVREFLRR